MGTRDMGTLRTKYGEKEKRDMGKTLWANRGDSPMTHTVSKFWDFILLPFICLALWLGDKVDVIRAIEEQREED